MDTMAINQNSSMNSSKKEISDYFLDIVLNIKCDSAKIDECANNLFLKLNEPDKVHLLNALNKISNSL